VRKCVVTRETIADGRPPTLVTEAVADDSPDDFAAESA
jgi:ATP-dependent Clp protease ATP-binding subunit ClpX